MLFRLLFQLNIENDQQACNSLQEKKVSCENIFRNTTGGEWQKSGVNAVTRTVWLFSRRGSGAGVCQHFAGRKQQTYPARPVKKNRGAEVAVAVLFIPTPPFPFPCGQKLTGKTTRRRGAAVLELPTAAISARPHISNGWLLLSPRVFSPSFFPPTLRFSVIKSSSGSHKALRSGQQQFPFPLLASGRPQREREADRHRSPW